VTNFRCIANLASLVLRSFSPLLVGFGTSSEEQGGANAPVVELQHIYSQPAARVFSGDAAARAVATRQCTTSRLL